MYNIFTQAIQNKHEEKLNKEIKKIKKEIKSNEELALKYFEENLEQRIKKDPILINKKERDNFVAMLEKEKNYKLKQILNDPSKKNLKEYYLKKYVNTKLMNEKKQHLNYLKNIALKKYKFDLNKKRNNIELTNKQYNKELSRFKEIISKANIIDLQKYLTKLNQQSVNQNPIRISRKINPNLEKKSIVTGNTINVQQLPSAVGNQYPQTEANIKKSGTTTNLQQLQSATGNQNTQPAIIVGNRKNLEKLPSAAKGNSRISHEESTVKGNKQNSNVEQYSIVGNQGVNTIISNQNISSAIGNILPKQNLAVTVENRQNPQKISSTSGSTSNPLNNPSILVGTTIKSQQLPSTVGNQGVNAKNLFKKVINKHFSKALKDKYFNSDENKINSFLERITISTNMINHIVQLYIEKKTITPSQEIPVKQYLVKECEKLLKTGNLSQKKFSVNVNNTTKSQQPLVLIKPSQQNSTVVPTQVNSQRLVPEIRNENLYTLIKNIPTGSISYSKIKNKGSFNEEKIKKFIKHIKNSFKSNQYKNINKINEIMKIYNKNKKEDKKLNLEKGGLTKQQQKNIFTYIAHKYYSFNP